MSFMVLYNALLPCCPLCQGAHQHLLCSHAWGPNESARWGSLAQKMCQNEDIVAMGQHHQWIWYRVGSHTFSFGLCFRMIHSGIFIVSRKPKCMSKQGCYNGSASPRGLLSEMRLRTLSFRLHFRVIHRAVYKKLKDMSKRNIVAMAQCALLDLLSEMSSHTFSFRLCFRTIHWVIQTVHRKLKRYVEMRMLLQ